MKFLIPITATAALVASGLASAQAPAYSKPSGYVTQTLEANKFNILGLVLSNPPVNSGDFELTGSFGQTLTDSDTTFAPLVGQTYILQITSGILVGAIQEVSSASITGNTITTPQDLQALGIVDGDTYTLTLAPTIETVFGTGGSVINRGPNAGSPLSDIIWIPTASGSYSRYYIRTSDSTVRSALTNAATPNVPIVFTDGLIVEKRNTGNSSLVVTGQVKTNSSSMVISPGFNLIGTVFPVGATLQGSGLASAINSGPNPGSPIADVVWVVSAPGVYTRFYRRTNDSTWRNALTNVAAPVDFPLSSGVFIEKRSSGSANLTIAPPAFYSNF